jgi:MFS family permease
MSASVREPTKTTNPEYHRVEWLQSQPASIEKEPWTIEEAAGTSSLADNGHNADVDADTLRRERIIMRKVDWRLLPLCGALYAISLIDRLNLPNARLAGMDAALGLSIGNRYSIITMVFFIGYIICDFPANFIMRKIGSATFLGLIGFGWGILTIGMGFCRTWVELVVCRIIFGGLEGGLFPGLIFLLSCWYVRHEVQVRFSGFYGTGMVVSGLSNLLAYGLSEADGLAGVAGWSWIFIFGECFSSAVRHLKQLSLNYGLERLTQCQRVSPPVS